MEKMSIQADLREQLGAHPKYPRKVEYEDSSTNVNFRVNRVD